VWQWVVVTFAPLTSGTWNSDNTVGVVLSVEVASNSTPNTVGAINQYAAITGVVILPGLEAPSAARSPLIMRPYDQELLTCKRYWEKMDIRGMPQQTGGYIGLNVFFTVQKKSTPTATYVDESGNPGKFNTASSGANQSPTGGSLTATIDRFNLDALFSSPGNWVHCIATADARLS
jgi:hypothetical protein